MRARFILEECRRIGFNDEVRSGERSFHVQTEVVGRDALTVRSTVLEGGIVRYASTRDLFPAAQGDVSIARALAEAHHRETLGIIAKGELE